MPWVASAGRCPVLFKSPASGQAAKLGKTQHARDQTGQCPNGMCPPYGQCVALPPVPDRKNGAAPKPAKQAVDQTYERQVRACRFKAAHSTGNPQLLRS
jgi:hypothetical protein